MSNQTHAPRIRPTYYGDTFVGFHVEVFNHHSQAYESTGINHPRYVSAFLSQRALESGKEPIRGIVTDDRTQHTLRGRRFRVRETVSRWLQVIGVSIASLGMFGCATFGDNWNEDNTTAEVAYQAINILDALQTDRIRSRDDLVEVGPIARRVMGPEPSRSDVAMYFSTLAISHALISAALPDRWRPWWQGSTAISQGFTVTRNCTKYELLCK